MTIQEYVSKMIQHLGVEENVTIDLVEEAERLRVNIQVPQERAALLIGNHGETMEAIELLTKLSFKDEFPEKRIIVDINDYRQQAMDKLKEKVLEVAARVLESGRPFEFRNLNSYERFQVHSVVAEDSRFAELTTFSEDRGPDRVLLIAPKSMVEEEVNEDAAADAEVPAES